MKLKAKERCPIHKALDCCGRGHFPRYAPRTKQKHGVWEKIGPGRWRAADGREKRSPASLKARKDDLLRKGTPCAACKERFEDYRDAELAHRTGKGMGGAFRDDSDKNTTLLHYAANRDQGSMDLETYLTTKWKPEVCQS